MVCEIRRKCDKFTPAEFRAVLRALCMPEVPDREVPEAWTYEETGELEGRIAALTQKYRAAQEADARVTRWKSGA